MANFIQNRDAQFLNKSLQEQQILDLYRITTTVIQFERVVAWPRKMLHCSHISRNSLWSHYIKPLGMMSKASRRFNAAKNNSSCPHLAEIIKPFKWTETEKNLPTPSHHIPNKQYF